MPPGRAPQSWQSIMSPDIAQCLLGHRTSDLDQPPAALSRPGGPHLVPRKYTDGPALSASHMALCRSPTADRHPQPPHRFPGRPQPCVPMASPLEFSKWLPSADLRRQETQLPPPRERGAPLNKPLPRNLLPNFGSSLSPSNL